MNNIKKFLDAEVKPILSEDEKVILRNINLDEAYIKRENNTLNIYDNQECNGIPYYFFNMYKHLFQFIKERRRI